MQMQILLKFHLNANAFEFDPKSGGGTILNTSFTENYSQNYLFENLRKYQVLHVKRYVACPVN